MNKLKSIKTKQTLLHKDVSPWGEMYACMKNFGWDQVDLARVLDVSEATVSNLLNGRITITVQLAETLSIVFGETAEYWILKQLDYRKVNTPDLRSNRVLRLKAMLYKLFPIRDLFQAGWISSESDVKIIVTELETLLGKQTYNLLFQAGLQYDSFKYRFTLHTVPTQELLWVSKAKSIIPTNRLAIYSSNKIQAIQSKIHYYSFEEDGVNQLLHDFSDAGVSFKILSSLPKLNLVGGLMWVEGNPAFVYTMRNNSITAFKMFLDTMLSACLLYEVEQADTPQIGNNDSNLSQRRLSALNFHPTVNIHSAETVLNRRENILYQEDNKQSHLIPSIDVLLSFALSERMKKMLKHDIVVEAGTIEFPEHCYYKGGSK